MAIKMVREPSDTPNISNIDDIIPFRYAYGNQNGYVIGKGTEISNTVNGLNFTVNSGRLVLQGVECEIDATGVTITIDNIATTRYYVVYLQVNLGLNTAQILSTYDTATYPTIDAGDDLTENTTGIARFPLYRFIATSGVISEINKVVESVKYVDSNFIQSIKVNNSFNSDDSQKVNGLEIKKDDNGVLRIGDVIIPQKKILLDATESPISLTWDDTTLFTDTKSLVGRTFEIVFTSQYAERNSFFKSAKFKIFSSSAGGAGASFDYYIDRNNDNSDYVGFLSIKVAPENPNAMLASATKHNVNKAGIENLTRQFSVRLIYEIIE